MPSSRFVAKGLGSANPIVDNSSSQSRVLNNRIETSFLQEKLKESSSLREKLDYISFLPV